MSDKSPASLWKILADRNADFQGRVEILKELAVANADGIADFIIKSLRDHDADARWLCQVLIAAERANFQSWDQRRQIATAVLGAIDRLGDTDEVDPVLLNNARGAGIRRFGRSAPKDWAHQLLPFVRSDRPDLAQKAFVALRTMFSVQAPSPSCDLKSLRSAISDYLQAGFKNPGRTSRTVGHLITAVIAAAAIDTPGLAELLQAISPPLKDFESQFVHNQLAEYVNGWQAPGDDPDRQWQRNLHARNALDALSSDCKVATR